MNKFNPNFQNIVNAARNIEAKRLPLYEHNISDRRMELILNKKFADLFCGDQNDINEYQELLRFFPPNGV